MKKMSHRTQALAFYALSFSLFAVACAAPSAEEGVVAPEVDADADAIKKKVKPTGGNGAVDFLAPAWPTTAMYGHLSVGGSAPLRPGDRFNIVAGTYDLRLRVPSAEAGIQFEETQTMQTVVAAGAVSSVTPGGLKVRFAEPITFGTAVLRFGGNTLRATGGFSGQGWEENTTGVGLLTLPGYSATLNSTTGAISAAGATELRYASQQGQLVEVVLPVATAQVQLDAYDAAYPTPSNAAAQLRMSSVVSDPILAAYLTQLQGGTYHGLPVRNSQTGAPALGRLVLPAGPNVVLNTSSAGSASAPQKALSGTNSVFVLNRLEVDDVEVRTVDGRVTVVRGTYTVSRTDQGVAQRLDGPFATHTGIDLPDGTYEITSTATTPAGPVTHKEVVSFP